jgi:NTE family protein
MTTAFVLSGGGSLGAVQVGMLQALAERDVRPDLLIGTSAGALNAAYVAGHGTGRPALEDLAAIWRGLRRQDWFPSTRSATCSRWPGRGRRNAPTGVCAT